jgi:hypothetical protein
VLSFGGDGSGRGISLRGLLRKTATQSTTKAVAGAGISLRVAPKALRYSITWRRELFAAEVAIDLLRLSNIRVDGVLVV